MVEGMVILFLKDWFDIEYKMFMNKIIWEVNVEDYGVVFDGWDNMEVFWRVIGNGCVKVNVFLGEFLV